ncbi:hypothetical protein IWZ01DRAFT_179311 [Phyllosticta capitalensis]
MPGFFPFSAWIGLDWSGLGQDSLLSHCAWTRLELARSLWLAGRMEQKDKDRVRRWCAGDDGCRRGEDYEEGMGVSLRCHDDHRYCHGLPLPLPPQLYASTVTCFAGTLFKYPSPLFLVGCAHSLAWLGLNCFASPLSHHYTSLLSPRSPSLIFDLPSYTSTFPSRPLSNLLSHAVRSPLLSQVRYFCYTPHSLSPPSSIGSLLFLHTSPSVYLVAHVT